jgi:hypothetical protein
LTVDRVLSLFSSIQPHRCSVVIALTTPCFRRVLFACPTHVYILLTNDSPHSTNITH